MAKEYYYKICFSLGSEGPREIFLESKGKIKQVNYASYYKNLNHFPKAESKGTLTLTEITKKEYDKFFQIEVK